MNSCLNCNITSMGASLTAFTIFHIQYAEWSGKVVHTGDHVGVTQYDPCDMAFEKPFWHLTCCIIIIKININIIINNILWWEY